jgi:hypothetical protein
MAAIGFTVNGQCVSVCIPWLVMYTATVVYHEPQMKNWRNIMVLRRRLSMSVGAGFGLVRE